MYIFVSRDNIFSFKLSCTYKFEDIQFIPYTLLQSIRKIYEYMFYKQNAY